MSESTFWRANAIAIPPIPSPAMRDVTSYPRFDRTKTPPMTHSVTFAIVPNGLMNPLWPSFFTALFVP